MDAISLTRNASPLPPEQEQLDLRALLGTLADHKWLILGVAGFFLIASIVYSMLTTPIYQANALVQVQRSPNALPELKMLISPGDNGPSPQATTAMALLTSRGVIGKAVQNLHLDISAQPQRLPVLGGPIVNLMHRLRPGELVPPLLGMAQYDWGGAKIDIARFDVPEDLLDEPMTLTADGGDRWTLRDADGNTLLEGKVGQASGAHGITLQVNTLRANPGTQFDIKRSHLQPIVTRLQNDINVTEDGKDSGVLLLTYNSTNPKLAAALLNQVSTQFVEQNIDRNSAEAAKSLAFVKEQLPQVQKNLEDSASKLNDYQSRSGAVNVDMQTQDLLARISAADATLQQLRLKQTEMARRYTPNYPAYKTLQAQIAEQEAAKRRLQGQVGGLPTMQKHLQELQRNVSVSNDTYTDLLHQAQQLNIARAGEIGNARVVDGADVDTSQPIWPRKLILIPAATAGGLLLAVVFVYLRQMLKRGVEDPAVIEQVGLPVYTSIPLSHHTRRDPALGLGAHLRGNRRQNLLALNAPNDVATEALRSLRTSLQFVRADARNNVLMISSVSPRVGKSFVCANLAALSAQTDQRVLLIDGDLRQGALHKLFGVRAERGLTELIRGQIEVANSIRALPGFDHLHFLPRGRTPANPSELLMTARFNALLQQLSPHYDLIIVDTPPILAVTDAAIIGRQAGTSLLVVRFDTHEMRDITLAKQRFAQNGVELKGAIFNAVEKRSGGFYNYSWYEYESVR